VFISKRWGGIVCNKRLAAVGGHFTCGTEFELYGASWQVTFDPENIDGRPDPVTRAEQYLQKLRVS